MTMASQMSSARSGRHNWSVVSMPIGTAIWLASEM